MFQVMVRILPNRRVVVRHGKPAVQLVALGLFTAEDALCNAALVVAGPIV